MALHRHAATRLFSLALLAASLLGGDCSSTDDPAGTAGAAGAAGGSTAAQAVARCTAMIDKLCTRIDTCHVQDKAGCIASNQSSLDCSRAIDVTDSYDQCVKDADAMTCEDTSVLVPPSCLGVIVLGAQGIVPGPGWMSAIGASPLLAE